MNKNLLIVIEGIDGCGKSTQVKKVSEKLKITKFTQPSDGPIGKAFRELLHSSSEMETKQYEEMFKSLIYADRIHVLSKKNGVVESLKNSHVIMDRHTMSTIAYNSLDRKDLFENYENNKPFIKPDLVVWLKLSYEEAIKRMNIKDKDIYENADKLKKVYDNYEFCFENFQDLYENILIIDANQKEDEILKQIINKINELENE